jgi:rubrerythrin
MVIQKKETNMTKTTQSWLSEIKSSPAKLEHWLQRQYVGEALAADRIQKLAIAMSGQCRKELLLMKIAADESKHCEWIKELLVTRNIPLPEVTIDNTRYWEPILNQLKTFEEIAGAGHHAEGMRLVRITALATDPEIAADIREVFLKILPDEQMHTKAFAAMSTAEGIESTRAYHEKGLEVLGLEI